VRAHQAFERARRARQHGLDQFAVVVHGMGAPCMLTPEYLDSLPRHSGRREAAIRNPPESNDLATRWIPGSGYAAQE
jgi:hypothetical protein